MSILTYIIACPFIGALLVLFVPRNYRFVIRTIALGAAFLSMLFAIRAFAGFTVGGGFQFVQQNSWVQALGMTYHVGADGLNIGLILMGAIVAFAATCMARDIKERDKEFYVLLLIMTGGILGAF